MAVSAETDPGAARRRGVRLDRRAAGELVFALLIFALGVYVLVGTSGIRVTGIARVAPTVFPTVVSVLLLVSSVAIAFAVLRGRLGTPEESEDADTAASTDWLVLAKITGTVVAHIILIGIVGWWIAAAALFFGVAWSLGAKRWWVALLAGLGVGLVVQLVMGRLLGLSLPPGPLLGWMG